MNQEECKQDEVDGIKHQKQQLVIFNNENILYLKISMHHGL